MRHFFDKNLWAGAVVTRMMLGTWNLAQSTLTTSSIRKNYCFSDQRSLTSDLTYGTSKMSILSYFYLFFIRDKSKNFKFYVKKMIFRFIRSSLAWPPNRRSISRSLKNSHSNTCWVYFPRFFGVENPNLRSDWCLDVHWGHWRRPMTSLDLQNGGDFRIRPLTHVRCLREKIL